MIINSTRLSLTSNRRRCSSSMITTSQELIEYTRPKWLTSLKICKMQPELVMAEAVGKLITALTTSLKTRDSCITRARQVCLLDGNRLLCHLKIIGLCIRAGPVSRHLSHITWRASHNTKAFNKSLRLPCSDSLSLKMRSVTMAGLTQLRALGAIT